MNSLVNLKKNIWIRMFCGKSYNSSLEHDRLDSWMATPSCSCTKSWEYRCITSKKEAKEFRFKYAKYIIKNGVVTKKDAFKTQIKIDIPVIEDNSIKDSIISMQNEKNLIEKVNKMEKIIIYLLEMVNDKNID